MSQTYFTKPWFNGLTYSSKKFIIVLFILVTVVHWFYPFFIPVLEFLKLYWEGKRLTDMDKLMYSMAASFVICFIVQIFLPRDVYVREEDDITGIGRKL